MSTTPHKTIRQALESVGLENRTDFRINTYSRKTGSTTTKLGIRVTATRMSAERTIAKHGTWIEEVTTKAGYPFTVRVDWTRSGEPRTYVFHTLRD